MKKKQLNSILIIGVLSIWGYLIYSKLLPSQENQNDIINDPISTSNNSFKKKGEFVLKANYRDPFLGKKIRNYRPKPTLNQTTRKSNKIVQTKTPEQWPSIRYYGLIKNTSNTKSGTALISVNGKSHRIKNGQKLDDLIVKKIYKDSLTMSLHRSTKTFYSKKKRI